LTYMKKKNSEKKNCLNAIISVLTFQKNNLSTKKGYLIKEMSLF
jgi:hypothetical protein